MKILFISDIHGITDNLDFIERKINECKIDKLVCLGDLYYNYYYTNRDDVHDFLNKYKDILICMRGNCETLLDIEVSDFKINDGIILINVDGIDMYLTHGNIYNYDNNSLSDKKGVLVHGHYHRPFIRRKNEMIYLNVGSISKPRNEIATYGIYENRCFKIYDIEDNIIDEIEL